MSHATISDLENGKRVPRASTMAKLDSFFKLNKPKNSLDITFDFNYDLVSAIDIWAQKQPDKPYFDEAVRRLVIQALKQESEK